MNYMTNFFLQVDHHAASQLDGTKDFHLNIRIKLSLFCSYLDIITETQKQLLFLMVEIYTAERANLSSSKKIL